MSSPFPALPEISFVDTDAERVRSKVIQGFEEATGQTLHAGNPDRLFLEGVAYVIAILAGTVDYAAKQSLLAYAVDGHLDHLGLQSATPRLGQLAATTMLRFSLQSPLSWDVQIVGGTRATTADKKAIFMTDTHAVIEAGKSYIDIPATAMEAGAEGNNLLPGQINTLIDPVAYIVSVQNINTTTSGADTQDNYEYRQHIALSREAYTCAGPQGMYEYFVKRVHKDIVDAGIYTPVPGTVGICPVMRGGQIPSPEVLAAIERALSADDVRPLTDTVKVHAPLQVPYETELQWFVSKGDASLVGTIGGRVSQAVADYQEWQQSKAGRDINPDELIARLKNVGVKRVEIRHPALRIVAPYELPLLSRQNIAFGGVEDE